MRFDFCRLGVRIVVDMYTCKRSYCPVDDMPKKKVNKTTRAKKPAKRRARGSGAETVYQELRNQILGLDIQPGTLLDETELAERFSLSRSPVREALIRLSAEGLVQTLRNRSSIVAPFDITAIPSYLDAVNLVYRLTTRLAARNRTQAQLEKIISAQEAHAEAASRNDVMEMISLNHDFHLAIAEASGNPFYVNWTRQILDQGQRMIRLYLYSMGDHATKDATRDHRAITRAIKAQDADAAEAAARRDAAVISDQMQKWFSSAPSATIKLS